MSYVKNMLSLKPDLVRSSEVHSAESNSDVKENISTASSDAEKGAAQDQLKIAKEAMKNLNLESGLTRKSIEASMKESAQRAGKYGTADASYNAGAGKVVSTGMAEEENF